VAGKQKRLVTAGRSNLSRFCTSARKPVLNLLLRLSRLMFSFRFTSYASWRRNHDKKGECASEV